MARATATLRLNPRNHEDSLVHFRDYFTLSSRNPGLTYLQEILEHFGQLPYENISKIINYNRSPDWEVPKIRLPENVMADHVDHRLGGTCFSLTFFLQSILTQSGFVCYPVMADMRAGRKIHCCLIAVLDAKKYLVDPGYLLTQPMELNPLKPKLFRTPFAGVEMRFNPVQQVYDLFTFSQDGVKWRYRFQDRAVPADEFLQQWLASFRRSSMNGICLTRVLKDGVLFVNRNFMRVTTFTQKTNFNIKRNYHAAIHERFGIDKEMIEQAQAALRENLARKRELGLWDANNE
ncbi:MAG: arylamine N-acetyltransferase [bacterium]